MSIAFAGTVGGRLVRALAQAAFLGAAGGAAGEAADGGPPNPNVFCFYYNWYGNVKHDGRDYHWSHPVLSQGVPGKNTVQEIIPGGDNIAANFFPALGAYSCADREIIRQHMAMLARARVGVLVLTWWQRADFGADSVPLIMDEAAKAGLKVAFHIEPFAGRNAQRTKDNLKLIIDTYGRHPALYRRDRKPLFFVYDSYLTSAEEWATLLKPGGAISIRGTPYDALMIGLWVGEGDAKFFQNSGFDGFYTYFGATGFTYGSTPENWPRLQQWAAEHRQLFIPCVAPGYLDTRVRPWNTGTARDREQGAYYDRMFKSAIDSGAPCIGITSFNEWHEGTQIEPAVPFQCKEFNYLDYSPLAPDHYLRRTAYWVGEAERHWTGNP
jgi:glycoprotein endo-alpha-1,2-mannosidase